MSADYEKIAVQVVQDGMITIPIEDYNLLLEHDTRLTILRDQVKNAIDTNDYKLCSDTFLHAMVGLLGYKPAKEDQNSEDKDE